MGVDVDTASGGIAARWGGQRLPKTTGIFRYHPAGPAPIRPHTDARRQSGLLLVVDRSLSVSKTMWVVSESGKLISSSREHELELNPEHLLTDLSLEFQHVPVGNCIFQKSPTVLITALISWVLILSSSIHSSST